MESLFDQLPNHIAFAFLTDLTLNKRCIQIRLSYKIVLYGDYISVELPNSFNIRRYFVWDFI